MIVTLAMNVNCPFGKNAAITGVAKGVLTVVEMVSISPGPPALPEPPFTLET